jgi:hypothetical protein
LVIAIGAAGAYLRWNPVLFHLYDLPLHKSLYFKTYDIEDCSQGVRSDLNRIVLDALFGVVFDSSQVHGPQIVLSRLLAEVAFDLMLKILNHPPLRRCLYAAIYVFSYQRSDVLVKCDVKENGATKVTYESTISESKFALENRILTVTNNTFLKSQRV